MTTENEKTFQTINELQSQIKRHKEIEYRLQNKQQEEIERLIQIISQQQEDIEELQRTINELVSYPTDEFERLYQIDNELKSENEILRNKLVELENEKTKICEEWETDLENYSNLFAQNKFLNQRVDDLEKSYNTINDELKRMNKLFKPTDLKSFMDLYGKIMERGVLKVIQERFYNETGIKYTQIKLKEELEQMGYQITNVNRKDVGCYVSKRNPKGFLYIVQLNEHIGTNIYKVGRTRDMRLRLKTYKQQYGGANVLICEPVSNQYKAESKLLSLLNEAVEKNELTKDRTGNEYFDGSLELLKEIYQRVVDEFSNENN